MPPNWYHWESRPLGTTYGYWRVILKLIIFCALGCNWYDFVPSTEIKATLSKLGIILTVLSKGVGI